MLALTQAAYSRRVMCGGHEMKSAQSFDGDNPATPESPGGGAQSPVSAKNCFTGRVPQLEPRTAGRARVRLCVEAAVARVFIFSPALRAHCELLHRRVSAVVGQGLDDAETRAAIRAIGERVTVTAVFWIQN